MWFEITYYKKIIVLPFLFSIAATKYDLPSIPMKLVNTTTFSKKQKEKLRKKQEKLDRVLETLGVEEYEFLETFRDKPLEVS